MQLLIVEDQANDLRLAASVAEHCGFSAVEAKTSANAARTYLQKGLEGQETLPDAILLDLDLGHDSGFELLRFWHHDARLSKIPLVVWTVLGDHYREICQIFNVSAYLMKGDDPNVLRQVLSRFSSRTA